MSQPAPNHLYGLVDMGSNGIRFSITDLSPTTARSLPTVFQDRLGTSLYDAQYTSGEKGAIPQGVIEEVIRSLLRFKAICADFEVSEDKVKILATEATRTAGNSEDYRAQIRQATGWEVDMLSKEMEGRIGAMGVASSFSKVEGLVMDLGGGSTQITWMVAEDGEVTASPRGAIGFPYGAAALTRRLLQISVSVDPLKERADLEAEMRKNFQDAYDELEVPQMLHSKAEQDGMNLYLSGGGFRGWGYLLMSHHSNSPYPIPIINGFQVRKNVFEQIADVQEIAASQDIFRVSKRRAAQVPAVALLVKVLTEAIPMIEEIRFCQGGVREGFLFDSLDKQIKVLDPLPSTSIRYAGDSSAALADLMTTTLPIGKGREHVVPPSLRQPVIKALADLMFLHSSLPKESTSLAALYAPITGQLASAHGVSHTDRALLALMLCRRWNSELAPPHHSLQSRLRAVITPREVWWCNYLGTIAKLIGDVYPSGKINEQRLGFDVRWDDGLGKKKLEHGLILTVHVRNQCPMTQEAVLQDHLEKIKTVGKKKNWIGGRDGFGIRIETRAAKDLS